MSINHVVLLFALFYVAFSAPPRVLFPSNYTWALLAWGFPNGGKDTTTGMQVVDVDIDEQNDQIAGLRSAGHIVICYFSAGTIEPFRQDCQANKALWESAAVGKMTDWDEEWLDIRKIDLLKQLMTPRFQKAISSGCHAIEPDNTDCFDNSDCWKKMGFSDGSKVIPFQLQYNQWLADYAHSNGLSIALKNTVGLIDQLGNSFDCAINEQCQEYGECAAYSDFVATKAVFQIEYHKDTSYCSGASQFSTQTKYCPIGSSDGLCSASGQWTNCFKPTNPLPPTRWTNGTTTVITQ